MAISVLFLLSLCASIAVAQDGEVGLMVPNARWHSLDGSCFDEVNGPISFVPGPSADSIFKRYIGSVGLHPRQVCGSDETICWAVSCCRPGEICGAIDVGCQVSWSTIYTTTITTSWSTITSWVVPHTSDVAYTTITVDTTTYATIFLPLTLPGEGTDDVIDTAINVVPTLILSAYTPPAVTTTETITEFLPESQITAAPLLGARDISSRKVLPRAEAPRRKEGISYTTLTVYVTTFFTTSTTATLSNSIVEITTTRTISSVATRNQTHYETPTDFATMTVTVTSISTSYAYGTVDAPTQVYYITTTAALESVGLGPGVSLVVSPGGSRSLSSGAIAGLTLGLLFALALVVVGIVLFRRHRKDRAKNTPLTRNIFDDPPSPPGLQPPKPAMTISDGHLMVPSTLGQLGSIPGSPSSELFFSGLNMTDEHKYNRNLVAAQTRRGSRISMMSAVSPVPEEDVILPENPASSAQERESLDGRGWGRGYGGRGGYYNIRGRNRNSMSTDFGNML